MSVTATRHIALFLFGLTGGGAQRRTLTLANAFAARGHEVDLVVVVPGGVLAAELDPRVRTVVLRPEEDLGARAVARGSRRGLRTAAAIPALARYLRRQQPDVLLSAASHANLVAAAAHALARLPIALVLRASNHPSGHLPHFPPGQRLVRLWLRLLARRLYRRADLVIAVSAGVAREVRALTGLPAERVRVIPNPVYGPELLARMEEPLAHPWFDRPGPPVVLGCGTFKLQKGFPVLLDAFARLRRRRPLRLVLLGDGPLRPLLEARIHALGLARDVLLPGYVANPLPWMRRAALFVLSSLWEGLPGALIEAMACGCPVVATDCPSGPREILEDGRLGPLVPPGDAAALAEAMARVLDDPPPAAALRARAADFAVDAAVDAYLAALVHCIDARARARLARIPPWPLRRPLDETTDRGLDYVLGRLGLERADLFRPLPGNPPHRRRMARMMARVGLDPARVVRLAWAELRRADRRCLACTVVARCEWWLCRAPAGAEPPAFCPNADLFRGLRAALAGA